MDTDRKLEKINQDQRNLEKEVEKLQHQIRQVQKQISEVSQACSGSANKTRPGQTEGFGHKARPEREGQ